VLDPVTGEWRRPFVCRLTPHPDRFATYVEDCGARYPVRFFNGTDRRRPVSVAEPATLFLLGTDELGRDQLSRLLVGGQVSLFVALLGTLLAVTAGSAAGLAAGYVRGWTDRALTGAGELFLALPWLYLLLAARAALPLAMEPRTTFLALALLVGAIGWARPARLVRSVVVVTTSQDFVTAARALGASPLHIVRRHLAGAAAWVAVAQALVLAPQFMLLEVALSVFGLGLAEPVPSWGTMLASALRPQVVTAHGWLLAPLGGLISVCVMYYALAVAVRAVPRT
jgi:peptide/nickel transport system permease protein